MNNLLISIIENFKQEQALVSSRNTLLQGVKQLIKDSGFKDDFVMKELEMEKSAFYRRMKKPTLWTKEEIERLNKLLKR